MPAMISALTGPDWALLREHTATIQALVKKRYGASLEQSIADLALLQKLLDEGVYDETQPDGLRAIGTVLGQVVERQLAFEWVLDGDAPALRLKAANLLVVKPHALVIDRLRVASRVDLAAIYNGIKADAKSTRII